MMILMLLKSTLGPLLLQLASQAVLKELLLWVGELIVQSTKTPHDNTFLDIVKEAWNATEKGKE